MRDRKTINAEMDGLRQEIVELDRADYLKDVRPKAEALVGKFFKYRNSYSSGERWWLYKSVVERVGYDKSGESYDNLITEQFETTSIGRSQLEIDIIIVTKYGVHHFDGYEEITADEYYKARNEFMVELQSHSKMKKALAKDD